MTPVAPRSCSGANSVKYIGTTAVVRPEDNPTTNRAKIRTSTEDSCLHATKPKAAATPVTEQKHYTNYNKNLIEMKRKN